MGMYQAHQLSTAIHGQPVLELSYQPTGNSQGFAFRKLQLLPSRGMSILNLWVHLPGRGEFNIFKGLPLEEAKIEFEDNHSFPGNTTFKYGGAFLAPFANRIRGELKGDKHIRTKVGDKESVILANWSGKNRGAERHAIHGFLIDSEAKNVQWGANEDFAYAMAQLDHGVHKNAWPGDIHYQLSIKMRARSMIIDIVAINEGEEKTAVGIGWHPYFMIPSNNRPQALLSIPASRRLELTNYDDVFTTGRVLDVASTDYDFRKPRPLDALYLDDCFITDGAEAKLLDPAAGIGYSVKSLSPEIMAFQVYAPVDKPYVAIEPQFNLIDPLNSTLWKNQKSGMVTLNPQQKTHYGVELTLIEV